MLLPTPEAKVAGPHPRAGGAMLTGMPLPVAAAVLGSALMHATWNGLAKSIPHRLLASALIGATFLVVGGAWCAVAPSPLPASWPYLAISAVLQTGYLLLLTAAYSRGEFRKVYPVARGTAPVLVTIVSVTVLGEHLHATQLAGIALVAAALGVLVSGRAPGRAREGGRVGRRRGTGRRGTGARGTVRHGGNRRGTVRRGTVRHGGPVAGVALAVATGVVIASYSLVDGLGVRHSGSAAGYAAWLIALHGALVVITCLVLAGPRQLARWLRGADAAVTPSGAGRDRAEGRTAHPDHPTPRDRPAHPGRTAPPDRTVRPAPDRMVPPARRSRPRVMVAAGVTGGVLSLAAYAIVLWAQDRASLALVSATRETSVLFAGVIGALFFAEGFSARQTVAAAAVVAGIVLMQLG